MPESREEDVVASALQDALELLGMDLAFLGRYVYGYEEFRGLAGDAAQFGLTEGFRLPFSHTVCREMSRGRVPNLIPDAMAEPALAGVPLVRDGIIRAYAGVPVVARDGTEYGALCCLSGHVEPELNEGHLEKLRALAEALGEHLPGRAQTEPLGKSGHMGPPDPGATQA